MKALKYIGGVLIATIGVLFTLGSIGLAFDRESDVPMWASALACLVGLIAIGGAVALFKTIPREISASCCPKCGGTEQAPAGIMKESCPFWSFPLLLWLFPLPFLWEGSRKQQVRCIQCDALYLTEKRHRYVIAIIFWITALLGVVGMIVHYSERQ